jgi:hypothetical protein
MNRNKELKELIPIIKEKFAQIIPEEILILKDVLPINHSLGHPYTIGPKHIDYASEHSGGMLDEDTLKAVKCAHPNCNASFDEHTYDLGMFIQLAGNIRAKIIMEYTGKFIEEVIPESLRSITGFVMVETPEKFRPVEDPKEKES